MNAENTDEAMPVGVSIGNDEPIKTEANIHLVINHRVLDVLKRYDLNINQLFILLAMYDDAIGLLDVYDDNFGSRKILVEDYQHLHIHGFLKIPSAGAGPVYQLDEQGKTFVEQIRVLFEIPEEERQVEANLKKLATDYLELWPRIKFPSGVYARVSSVEIEKKLKAFLRVYTAPFKRDYQIKLTPELILEATKSYVTRFAKKNYEYAVNSSYFIQKKEKSTLADEILAIKQGTVKNEDKWTKQL